MRVQVLLVLVLWVLWAVLGAQAATLPGASLGEAVDEEEEEEGIALSALTDGQLDAALDSMTTATLVQIIKSQGYEVEEGLEPAKILQAAKVLVKQERDRQLAEKGAGGGSSSGGVGGGSTPAIKHAAPQATAAKPAAAPQASTRAASTPAAPSTPSTTNNNLSLAGWTHRQPVPPGATAWECFQAQIASDFAPLVRLVPAPVREALSRHGSVMAGPLRQMLCGAVGPMLGVAGRVLNVAGRGIEQLGGEVSRWSESIATLAADGAVGARAAQNNWNEEEEDEAEIVEL